MTDMDTGDVAPNQTIYINHLNEKVKKDGACAFRPQLGAGNQFV
jgi:hypothetical protein